MPPPLPASPGRRFTALLGFLHSESAAGLALIIAAAAALVWSNSPASGSYMALLKLPIALSVGPTALALPLEGWVNDGLMALFFLTVGLEIRREITEGQLASWPRMAAPGLAAVGGMVAPALIFAAFNRRDPQALHGWAVPVATDIAFALAALSVLGRRVPMGLKVFLTALAIIDDLGAIVVIAVFYTQQLNVPALIAACVVWGALYGLNRAGVRALSPYVLGGILLWGFVLHSGIHPTLAGVALAFAVPMGGEADCPAHRLETGLGGWVTWGVLPLFGLANAGLRFGGISVADLTSPLVLGTTLGLLVGKQVGVFGAVYAAIRLRLAHIPGGVTLPQLYGGAVLCGIGFTMSLFIGDLSFHGSPLHAQVKLAVFAGSLLSAALGIVVLAIVSPRLRISTPAPAAAQDLERT
ncbi:MAG: Na+/H+ antiporter NhaA [Rhodospirillales bacterium 20-64-7]|nr:MAG: Na+/H+ antiporter NhaA [Rhodospirillales bacterium 20-64-7]